MFRAAIQAFPIHRLRRRRHHLAHVEPLARDRLEQDGGAGGVGVVVDGDLGGEPPERGLVIDLVHAAQARGHEVAIPHVAVDKLRV
jgi:hypothetical protein